MVSCIMDEGTVPFSIRKPLGNSSRFLNLEVIDCFFVLEEVDDDMKGAKVTPTLVRLLRFATVSKDIYGIGPLLRVKECKLI